MEEREIENKENDFQQHNRLLSNTNYIGSIIIITINIYTGKRDRMRKKIKMKKLEMSSKDKEMEKPLEEGINKHFQCTMYPHAFVIIILMLIVCTCTCIYFT